MRFQPHDNRPAGRDTMHPMKSLRLDPGLEERLKQAATVAGVSESELMRSAVGEKVDTILGRRADQRLASVVGRIHGGGGRARDAHQRFGALLIGDKESRRPDESPQRQQS